MGRFNPPGRTIGQDVPHESALGTFVSGPDRPYGYVPSRPGRRLGLGTTPALTGLFRAGRVVGVSQINAMATNVFRGG